MQTVDLAKLRTGHPRLQAQPGFLGPAPALHDLLVMDDQAFAQATPKSAMKRAHRRGLVRNAATAPRTCR